MYVYVCFGPYTKQQEQQGEDSWLGEEDAVMMMMIKNTGVERYCNIKIYFNTTLNHYLKHLEYR